MHFKVKDMCREILTFSDKNCLNNYIILYININTYIYIALWHTKLCFHVQIEHSTRMMNHCCSITRAL